MAQGLFNLKQVIQGIQQGDGFGQRPPAVEYLVVAGGGGGARNASGGGGAGGLLTGILNVATGSSITATVGAGGAAGLNAAAAGNNQGSNGSASVFGSISTAGGGGGGGAYNSATQLTGIGSSGGSGGGGSTDGSVSLPSGGQATSGQGNAGGIGGSSTVRGAGGGGGAGTVGLNGINQYGGNGGAGIASAINGTVTTYAGGGGGGAGTTGGSGGVGGGGSGGAGGAGTPTAGSANTGGGGGGDWNNISSAGSGGSGIAIVSYPDVYAAAASTTGSPTVSTSGSGSIAFSGTGQYLATTNNNQFQFGTGDFTIEFWVYPNNSGSYYIATNFDGSTVDTLWGVYTASGVLQFTGWVTPFLSGGALTASVWNHVAICRSGTTLSSFINGSRVATATNSQNFSGTSATIRLATSSTGTTLLNGNISNFRTVKGTAIYSPSSSTITVPTAPLTAVTNTSMLLNTVSGAYLADSSTNAATFTVTGSPAWNASSPFTVTGYKNRVYTWTSSGSITF